MAIDHDEFVRTIQDRSNLRSPDQAKRAAEATLATLSERVSRGAMKTLAAELPTGFRESATPA